MVMATNVPDPTAVAPARRCLQLERVAQQSNVAAVIAPLLDEFHADYQDVLAELAAAPDRLRRESLLEAKEGLEIVVAQLSRVRDLASAHVASENLQRSIEGMRSAIKVQIVNHALDALRQDVLGPIQPTIPPETAWASAVTFLRREIKPHDQRAILADMTELGLPQWSTRNHMLLGMAVRNKLRAAGLHGSRARRPLARRRLGSRAV